MKLIKNLITLLLLGTIFLTSCASIKDAMTGKKKKTGDEFLVKKKNPLVMPPEFGEMPIPMKEEELIEEENDNDIEELITKIPSKDKKKNNNKKISKSLEKSIIKKINGN